ncbi:MAG: hypothetical protein JWO49_1438 [Arthrobacter sp.]|nr:hypothetical protein [Arthrobacter sp.]
MSADFLARGREKFRAALTEDHRTYRGVIRGGEAGPLWPATKLCVTIIKR